MRRRDFLAVSGAAASTSTRRSGCRRRRPPATGEWPADEPLQETFRRGLQRTFTIS